MSDSTPFSLTEQSSKSSPNQISFFAKLTIAPLILSPSNSASDKIAQSSQTKHFFARKISHYLVNDSSNDSSKHDNIRNMEILSAFGSFGLSANGEASFFFRMLKLENWILATKRRVPEHCALAGCRRGRRRLANERTRST